jgi:hypothetical protein
MEWHYELAELIPVPAEHANPDLMIGVVWFMMAALLGMLS